MKGSILEVLSIPCDLSYMGAVKARQEFEKMDMKATVLYVSAIDDVLAHRIVKEEGLIGLTVQVVSDFAPDTWSVGDDDHFGVGSVGA